MSHVLVPVHPFAVLDLAPLASLGLLLSPVVGDCSSSASRSFARCA